MARQALLAQWTLDQRRSMGDNTTIASDLLAHIKVSGVDRSTHLHVLMVFFDIFSNFYA